MKLYLQESIITDKDLPLTSKVILNYLIMIWYASKNKIETTVQNIEAKLGISTVEVVTALNLLSSKGLIKLYNIGVSKEDFKLYKFILKWEELYKRYPEIKDLYSAQ